MGQHIRQPQKKGQRDAQTSCIVPFGGSYSEPKGNSSLRSAEKGAASTLAAVRRAEHTPTVAKWAT